MIPAILALIAGGIGALGLPPYGLWPLTILSLVGTSQIYRGLTDWRQASLVGWTFGTGYFGIAFSWIFEPFLVGPKEFAWLAFFAPALLAAGLALFWALAFTVAHWLSRTSIFGLLLSLAAVEVARAYLFSGFPWAGFAQIWIGTGPDLLLSIIGPQGLMLVTLIVAAMVFGLLEPKSNNASKLLSAVGLTLLVLVVVTFSSRLPAVTSTEAIVRIVQPNASQEEKWDRDKIPKFFARQLTATGAGDSPPDLIVWPESAIAPLLDDADAEFRAISKAARGAIVVLGVNRRDEEGYYNSMVALDRFGHVAQRYDKQKLVPFGEFMPFPEFFRKLGIRGLAEWADRGYVAGSGLRRMMLGDLGLALPLICYEAIFPELARNDAQRPDLLLQITNDAWFGTRAGPYQHFAQARMRAIEQGLPIIRAANTGISAAIDPFGRIVEILPLGATGFVDAKLPTPLPKTLYSRTGDGPAITLIVVLLLTMFFGKVAQLRPES